jgi:peptide/nickel transport system substrate-binding protein
LATAENIQDQLARFGIHVYIVPYDNDLLTSSVIAERKFDVLLFGQSFQHDTALYAFWHSSQRTFPGLNITQYANTITDALLERARKEHDYAIRQSLYREFAEAIERDHPVVYLYAPVINIMTRPGIHMDVPAGVSYPHDRWNRIYRWYLHTHRVWTSLI